MPDARLYETDFYAWTQEQAAALRRMAEARANTELDLENLAEAIEDMGGSDLRALEGDLGRVIEHLLKLEHSPAADPQKKWTISTVEHRTRVRKAIRKSGTLKRLLPELLPDVWDDARKVAAKAMELFDGVDPATLPDACPYGLEQILDDDFWPANRHGLT